MAWRTFRWLAFAVLLAVAAPAAAEQAEGLTGSIELFHRNVSVDGEQRKYDEDFDGLASGTRVGSLTVNWLDSDSSVVDFARLDVTGLGGDPFERETFTIGRRDSWKLRFNQTKQDYIYDLFELVNDEDGAQWDAERRKTDVDLTVDVNPNFKLFVGFQNGERTGQSLFMKDISRELFRFDAPLDAEQKRYTVGANLTAGVVDIVFRQTLRRYDNNITQSAGPDGDQGLTGGTAELERYEWLQNDSGSTDITSLRVNAPLGNRVNLTVGVFGTLFGEEELRSDVVVDQLGTAFNGAPFSGVGVSSAELEGDNTLFDVDLSAQLHSTLNLHLQYRTLDRDLDGTLNRDLDGDGTFEDEDGDGTPGSTTNFDYEIDTTTVLLDYRPVREVRLRGGYRMIDRKLNRSGFGGLRDTDFESDDDDTVIFGVALRPVKWLRLNADYEDGDISQPFNAVAASEREHTRVRASFIPKENMRVDAAYLDFDNKNTAPDFRAGPGQPQNFNSRSDGTTWSLSFWHRHSEMLDYTFRYAEQDVASDVRVLFDEPGFAGAIQPGNSIFDNDNKQFSGRIGFSWNKPWRGYLRWAMAESDGDNLFLGDVDGLINREPIDQELLDAEAGLNYTLSSGVWVGASMRVFDYDDVNNRLDYDGQIFTIRAGVNF